MSEHSTSTRKDSGHTQTTKVENTPDLDSQPAMVHPINVFVGGLPRKTTVELLTQFMSQFGYVKEVYISKDETTGNNKCFAFVNFHSIFRIEEFFGRQKFLNRYIDVKRSLQHYLVLTEVPLEAKEPDIVKVFRTLGHRVSEVLVGGKIPGVAPGTVGVRLLKFHYQLEIYMSVPVVILGKEVRKMLHVRQPRLGKNQTYTGMLLPVGFADIICNSRAPTLEAAGIQFQKSVDFFGSDSPTYQEANYRGSIGPNLSGTKIGKTAGGNSLQQEVSITHDNSKCSTVSATLHHQHGRNEINNLLPKFQTPFKGVPIQESSSSSEYCTEFSTRKDSSPILGLKNDAMTRTTISSPCFTPYQTNQIWISFYAFPGHL